MAAVAYETIPNSYPEDERLRPRLVEIKDAESWLLRALDRGNLAIRNNTEISDIPEQVPVEVDDLFSFVESRKFDEMKESVTGYVRKQAMREHLGSVAINESQATETPMLFDIGNIQTDALTMHMITSYAYERFGSVNSIHMFNLEEVDLSSGMPEDPLEQDRAVLLCMAAAVNDASKGTPLAESPAGLALGAERKPRTQPFFS